MFKEGPGKDQVGGGRNTELGGEPVERDVSAAVLRAVAAMARASKRQQAELGVALLRAGLALDATSQQAVLRHLCSTASVEDIIPLDDGGILLSVTSAGMQRARR